jgi:hypothetical protein
MEMPGSNFGRRTAYSCCGISRYSKMTSSEFWRMPNARYPYRYCQIQVLFTVFLSYTLYMKLNLLVSSGTTWYVVEDSSLLGSYTFQLIKLPTFRSSVLFLFSRSSSLYSLLSWTRLGRLTLKVEKLRSNKSS